MTGHTPGPWEVGEDDSNGQAIVRGKHTEVCTCWHHCVGSIEHQMRANARLIATAPELLEAISTLVINIKERMESPFVDHAEVEWVYEYLPQLKALIAKAKGEPC